MCCVWFKQIEMASKHLWIVYYSLMRQIYPRNYLYYLSTIRSLARIHAMPRLQNKWKVDQKTSSEYLFTKIPRRISGNCVLYRRTFNRFCEKCAYFSSSTRWRLAKVYLCKWFPTILIPWKNSLPSSIFTSQNVSLPLYSSLHCISRV